MTQNKAQEVTSQSFSVPIDEVKAITMKVSTTFDRDVIDSDTLLQIRSMKLFIQGVVFHQILLETG